MQWRNIGTVTPDMPGGPLHGGTKLHGYLFSKIRLKDGRRTKKIIGGIAEPEFTTVDGQKNYRGRQKSGSGGGEKKVAGKRSMARVQLTGMH